jgi:hypothetical protein
MAKGVLAEGEVQIRFEVGYVWGPIKRGKVMNGTDGSHCSLLQMPQAVWAKQTRPTYVLAQ